MRQLLHSLRQKSGMLWAIFWICQFSIINCQFAQAQVSVNSDGSNADPSAMFEVKSTEKGLLPPRMTTAQRDAIVSPATGLMLYNLDKKMMEYFDGTIWKQYFYPPSSEILCGIDFIDTRDNQVYPTIQIGAQCWMQKDLNVGTMVTSTYAGSPHSDVSNNGIIEKYCYNNDPANCAIYGGLYDWNEMMQYTTTEGVQGICPNGWHIPTDAEWTILTDYLGGEAVAGGKIKEPGFTHWTAPNIGATNESGFTALGAGYRYYYGGFANLYYYAIFWSSSESSSTLGVGQNLDYYSAGATSYSSDESFGFSLRCVRTY
ncbi:MAG: hypothetical protein NTU44_16690 [Bacteroidetes bacterium]|nr:hypothetical protein [Bacteroidota bacterium]